VIAAFFADDASASHAALLASSAFDRRSDQIGAPTNLMVGGSRIVGALPTYLDAARVGGRHLMVALPLAHLNDHAIRSRGDVAVVAFGPEPLAACAAIRAMAADALPDLAPPWLLACCSGGVRTAGLRVLPVTLGSLSRGRVIRLLAGEAGADLRCRSIGLAAALCLVAEDPHAPRLDPARLGELFDEAGTAAGLMLRTSFLELAADIDGDTGAGAPERTARRRTGRLKSRAPDRRRLGTAKPRVARRRVAGCACATSS
jgi:hypothetical protein